VYLQPFLPQVRDRDIKGRAKYRVYKSWHLDSSTFASNLEIAFENSLDKFTIHALDPETRRSYHCVGFRTVFPFVGGPGDEEWSERDAGHLILKCLKLRSRAVDLPPIFCFRS